MIGWMISSKKNLHGLPLVFLPLIFLSIMMVTNWLCFRRYSISLIFLLIARFITVLFSLSLFSTDLFDLCSIRLVSIVLLYSSSQSHLYRFQFIYPIIYVFKPCDRCSKCVFYTFFLLKLCLRNITIWSIFFFKFFFASAIRFLIFFCNFTVIFY